MHNLRLLKLHFERYRKSKSCGNKVHIPRGLECLPQALRIMQWDGYPLNSLPSKFCPENLVELCMYKSRLQRLWNKGLKINLGSLKHIDLSYSEHLADVSALIESPNLESIWLVGCTSLVQLPSSFQHLAKLTNLCLGYCYNLKILPEMPGNLEDLSLSGTAIEELPSSIWCLEKLRYLGLYSCKELKNIPSSTCRLISLQYLNLHGCLSLESLPVELPFLLTELCLSDCKSLGSLPVKLPSGLTELYLSNCRRLGSLPAQLPSGLQELYLRDCKSLGSLPVELPRRLWKLDLSNCRSLGSLPVELPAGLNELYLRNCKRLGSLPKLPWVLHQLDAYGCTSLETVSSSMRTVTIQGWDQFVNKFKRIWPKGEEEHVFLNCMKLDQSARSNIMADAQIRVMRFATAFRQSKSFKIVCPGNEIPKWVRYQSEGCSINIKLPPHSFRQGFLGYALCIVVAFNNYTPPAIGGCYFSCDIHYRINNGHEDCWDSLIGTRLLNIPIYSDHVFVWYFHPEYAESYSAINREDWVKPSEASFDFMLNQYTYQDSFCAKKIPIPFDLSTVRVKRCGVSLLYAQEIEKLLGGIDEDESSRRRRR